MIVVDSSGSMNADAGDGQKRIDAAKSAVAALVADLPAVANLLQELPTDPREDLIWRWTSVTPNHGDDEWAATKQLFERQIWVTTSSWAAWSSRWCPAR